MKAVWKFPLQAIDGQTVEMPEGAKILCVQVQNGVPCMWAVCDPAVTVRKEKRYFAVVGTGHPHDVIPKDYIGTFQLEGGGLVFHVFEVKYTERME